MLPAAARLTRRADFTRTVRRGQRGGGPLLVVHLLIGANEPADAPAGSDGDQTGSRTASQVEAPTTADPAGGGQAASGGARVGFVVGRGVGGAVVRNRVRRRLRDLARTRAARLPAGSLLVIRANPRAADARQRDLAAELDLVLDRLVRRQVRASDRP